MTGPHQFNADIRSLQKDLEALGKRAPLAMARALNRAGLAGQTAMVRAVVADTGLASKNVKREILLDKANRTQPRFALTIKGSKIPLIAFQARGAEAGKGGRGRGVSWKNPGSRGRQRDPQAFIATMASGHRGVFKRVIKSRSRKGRPRSSPGLPILELRGPALPRVFEKFVPVFNTAAQAALLTNLRHEIDFANRPAAST